MAPVDPQCTVRVRGALWAARTERGEPIQAGGGLVVAAIDGVVLGVEPAGAPSPEGGDPG